MKLSRDRKKILLADDDADDRALFLEAYLNRKDILLMPCVVNGADVIETLDSIPDDNDLPDLIILDQNMPLMNGRQTLIFLKTVERYAKIPICICSTYADSQLTQDCMRLGAYKVSSKPITDTEYQTMMDEFLTAFLRS